MHTFTKRNIRMYRQYDCMRIYTTATSGTFTSMHIAMHASQLELFEHTSYNSKTRVTTTRRIDSILPDSDDPLPIMWL